MVTGSTSSTTAASTSPSRTAVVAASRSSKSTRSISIVDSRARPLATCRRTRPTARRRHRPSGNPSHLRGSRAARRRPSSRAPGSPPRSRSPCDGATRGARGRSRAGSPRRDSSLGRLVVRVVARSTGRVRPPGRAPTATGLRPRSRAPAAWALMRSRIAPASARCPSFIRVPWVSTRSIAAGASPSHDGSTATSTRRYRSGLSRFSVRTSPWSTTTPRSINVIVSQRSSTRSSWWLENSTLRPSATWSSTTCDRNSTAPGSSPANGSSSTIRSGPCTIAAASCTRWAIPPDRSRIVSRARSSRPSRASRSCARSLRHLLVESVQPCDPHEVVGDTHVAVEPPLLGHVPPRPPVPGGGTSTFPLDRAGIRIEHAEDDPHQRGLAGTVRARADRSPFRRGHRDRRCRARRDRRTAGTRRARRASRSFLHLVIPRRSMLSTDRRTCRIHG